jgi:tetratricopeptide (TPR) repeat protein
MTHSSRELPAALLLGLLVSCGGGPDASSLEEARVLKQAGHFPEALVLFEEAFRDMDPVPSDLMLEYAETALLACGAERSRAMRQTALEALCTLMRDSTVEKTSTLGEMWRRLGWEMVRDRDSLQAYSAFDSALACDGMEGVFEEEWLVRGAYSSRHLSLVAGLPDSIALSPRGDSMLAASAELHLVELDRIPRMRTDLRPAVLQARALLLPFTDRRAEELDVLTELDRSGGIEPFLRERRIRLLLDLAREDIEQGSTVLAREKLNEVWSSDFAGDRVEAAVMLGEIAERAGRPDEALEWYRSACSAAPSLSTPAAELAAARRDSLMFLLP